MSTQEFVISPRPAVRAFAIAATAFLLGALLLVGSVAWEWGVVGMGAGVLLMLGGVALAVAAVVAARRQRVVVILDAEGFEVVMPRGEPQAGTWASVTRVTAAPGRITVHQGGDRRIHLIAPSGSDADLDALGIAISRHLDANRGYSTYRG